MNLAECNNKYRGKLKMKILVLTVVLSLALAAKLAGCVVSGAEVQHDIGGWNLARVKRSAQYLG